ncbi:hypothetical protein LTR94_032309, partial [Friedmanniomyces endolithicus]
PEGEIRQGQTEGGHAGLDRPDRQRDRRPVPGQAARRRRDPPRGGVEPGRHLRAPRHAQGDPARRAGRRRGGGRGRGPGLSRLRPGADAPRHPPAGERGHARDQHAARRRGVLRRAGAGARHDQGHAGAPRAGGRDRAHYPAKVVHGAGRCARILAVPRRGRGDEAGHRGA